MIRLRAGNRQGAGSTPGAYSETIQPRSRDRGGELRMGARVVAVDAAAEHGDRGPPASRAPRCASPSTPRASPLTTTSPAAASSRAERAGDLRAVRRARTRTDDRDGGPSAADVRAAAQEEARRRIVDRAQARRERGSPGRRTAAPAPRAAARYAASSKLREPLEARLARLVDDDAAGLRREHREGELAHGVASSVGER